MISIDLQLLGGRSAKFSLKQKGKKKASTADIPLRKLKNYLLNPGKDNKSKYQIFAALRYNMKNWKRLRKDIRKGPLENKAVFVENNSKGLSIYKVNIILGIDNKKRYQNNLGCQRQLW